jgi:hypothetical protein
MEFCPLGIGRSGIGMLSLTKGNCNGFIQVASRSSLLSFEDLVAFIGLFLAAEFYVGSHLRQSSAVFRPTFQFHWWLNLDHMTAWRK